MRSIVRFLVIAAVFSRPLAAQPFSLATPPVGPTPGNVLGAAAAWNGSVCLAVWAESRLGVVQIRGIHVSTGDVTSPGGVPVEASSFRISPSSGVAVEGLVSAPAVASDGNNFVVVWASKSRFYAALVLPTDEVRVLATDIDAVSLRIVWGGTAYVVLRATSAATLATTLLNADGTILIEDALVVSSPGGVGSPSLAVNDDGRAMAFWVDFADGDAHVEDVSVDRILAGGVGTSALQSPRPIYSEGAGTIASDGSGFLAVWTAQPANPLLTTFTIFSRPIDSSGAPSGPVQTVAASAPPLVHPLVVWNGQNFLLVDANGAVTAQAITAQAINADGTPTAAGPYIITTHSGSAEEAEALVAGGFFGVTKTILFWRDLRFGHAEIFAQAGDTDALPVGDEILESLSPSDQSAGAAVWTGSDYVAVWTEKAGVSRIVAARANERQPILIASPQLTASTPSFPAVAAADGTAMIVWLDVTSFSSQQTALYRAVLPNSAGSPSSPALITSDVSTEAPSVAARVVDHPPEGSDGPTFAVAWTTRQREIAATTIDSAGNTVTTPVTLTVKPSDTFAYSSPRLAWTGSFYVLVRVRTLNDGRTILELQRLSTSLTLIGAPVQLTDGSPLTSVTAAGSPSGALVTWIQFTNGNLSVRAVRFSSAPPLADPPLSTVIDPLNGITVLAGNPANGPAAGWDGKNWRIGVDNMLVTLSPSGGVQLVQTIPLATRIAAIAGGGPTTFIAFDVDDPVDLTVRVYGQFLDDTPPRRRAIIPR